MFRARVVTKNSRCRVNTTSRRGIKQLGVSFSSFFFSFPLKVAGGNPRPPPLNDSSEGCEKVFKQQADNEQQVALELSPKALVLEGRGIQGHFKIQSLRNGISRGVEEVFFTADAMLFCQNTSKTGNNAIEMLQTLHYMAQFKRFTDLNLFKYVFNVIQNWNMDALQFYSMVLFFLLAVMGEGDESSRLRMANQTAVLAGCQPLLTALNVTMLHKSVQSSDTRTTESARLKSLCKEDTQQKGWSVAFNVGRGVAKGPINPSH